MKQERTRYCNALYLFGPVKFTATACLKEDSGITFVSRITIMAVRQGNHEESRESFGAMALDKNEQRNVSQTKSNVFQTLLPRIKTSSSIVLTAMDSSWQHIREPVDWAKLNLGNCPSSHIRSARIRISPRFGSQQAYQAVIQSVSP